MGKRRVIVTQSTARSIAEVSWFIESKGLTLTAERFSDAVYDFIEGLSDTRKSYKLCREPKRALLGLKCLTFKRKYTVVFIESDQEIIVCEFLSSQRIWW